MGWTISYEVELAAGAALPSAEALASHFEEWSARLSTLSGRYHLERGPSRNHLQGSTMPAPSIDSADDYVTLVLALRAFEARFPGSSAFISDTDDFHRRARPHDIDIASLRRVVREQWAPDDALDEPEPEEPEQALLQQLLIDAAAVGESLLAKKSAQAESDLSARIAEKRLVEALQQLVGAPAPARAPAATSNVIEVDFRRGKKG